MSEKDRKHDFETAYDIAWATWGSFQDVARNDLRAFTHNAFTEEDIRRFRALNLDPLSFPMIRRIIKLITGYQRRNGLSISYQGQGMEDDPTISQFNELENRQMAKTKGYKVISDAFEQALVTGINLVNVYQTRDWNVRVRRYPYNSFVLDPNFQEIDLSDSQFGIIRQSLNVNTAKRLIPGREKEIDRIARSKKQGGRDGKFPNMPNNHIMGDMLLNYDEFQRRITQKKKFFIWTAGPKAGQWFTDANGERNEWKGTQEQLKTVLQANPFLDVQEDWVENIEVTVYLEGNELASEIDPWGIGDFSYTPYVGFWVPEEDDIRFKIQGLVRSLRDPQRAHDKERNYALSIWLQQIGGGTDFKEGTLVDDEDAFAAGHKPRMFRKEANLATDVKERPTPDIPANLQQHTQALTDIMPQIVNLNDEIFGTVDGKSQIAGFLGQMRQNAALTGLGDLFDNLNNSMMVTGGKQMRLYQRTPRNVLERILNEQLTPEFYNKQFLEYDAIVAEGIRTDTQRLRAYQEIIALTQLASQNNMQVPWGMKKTIVQFSPMAMKRELLAQIEQQEKQQQEAVAAQQKQADAMQLLAMEQVKATINSENSQSVERSTQAHENRTSAALDRAKTIAQIQEIQTKPIIEAAKIAADLEKAQSKGNSE